MRWRENSGWSCGAPRSKGHCFRLWHMSPYDAQAGREAVVGSMALGLQSCSLVAQHPISLPEARGFSLHREHLGMSSVPVLCNRKHPDDQPSPRDRTRAFR